MRVVKLIAYNTRRHPLRTTLTVLGLAVTVVAFSVIRTTIDAWYAGADAASPNRLVTRHAVSFTFLLPMSHQSKIESVDGVTGVAAGTWFGGTYIEPKNFFPQFAVDHEEYMRIYPEFVVPPEQMEAFRRERNAVLVGRRLADRFMWKLGDAVRLTGTVFPGDWDCVIRGIYIGAKEDTDETLWFMRWDYIDERLRQESPGRAGWVGWFVVEIDDPSQAAAISERIDAFFDNSRAETKTETEEAFNLGFVEMGSSIVLGLQIVSVMVIGVILLVLGNTMAMTARERVSEYAVLKTLGFRPIHLIGLIFGESLFIAALGAVAGLLVSVPALVLIRIQLEAFFPVFSVRVLTVMLAVGASMLVGLLAAIVPTVKAVRTRIVDGLRTID